MKNYKANFNYFDIIDTPQKAYWLGFIFADGYIAKRDRGNRIEYNLKFSLKTSDASHLEKFASDIESNYPVHYYKSKGFAVSGGDREDNEEARLFITNKYMCKLLYEDYGIIPNRTSISKILEVLPESLYKYFILGLFEADGSFTKYELKSGKEKGSIKFSATFGGSEEILRFVESVLIQEDILPNIERKIQQRHKGADGTWRSIRITGRNCVTKLLNWLYDSPIHLERKYQKYVSLFSA